MSPVQRMLLEKLCLCEPGQGLQFPKLMHRDLDYLCGKGYAYSLIKKIDYKFWIATASGRKAIK